MNVLASVIKSVGVAWKGLFHALSLDKSFRLEVFLGFPIYAYLGCMLSPLTPVEWILFVLSYALILIVELINTSIETLLDRLHPGEHELIAKSKDIASGAVLLSFLFAGFVVLVLFLT
jgi:diacylglycerol kinase